MTLPDLRSAQQAIVVVVLALSPSVSAAPDSIWIANVVTVDDARPRAEAVAVEDGRISAVGAVDEVLALADERTRIERPDGVLVPGFVDAHGHVWLTGVQSLFADLLPPPDGGVRDLADLAATLKAWAEGEALDLPGGWIVGMGYDDAELVEQRHPTRAELDAVSSTRPVFAIHQSLHLGAVNSVALARLGIHADTPDPRGGHYRRGADGEPNGVLEETAFRAALGPIFGGLQNLGSERIVQGGLETYMANGFTTAQDGAASPASVGDFTRAAAQAPLPIDVVAFPVMGAALADAVSERIGTPYEGGFRVGGVKLVLDGSPQGKTAWLTRRYHVVPDGRGPGYAGYPTYPNARVVEWIDLAFERAWPVLAHANGDAAADQLIRAVRKATERQGLGDRRTVMIHAQTVRDDQLEAMAELDVVPSFFTAHTFYWGDWHRDSVLGPVRADRISPTRSARDRGLQFTAHHDSPVVKPNPLRILHATVNRRTRSGDILGPSERVDALTALKATTLWAARQHFEEADKGSIEVGKLADFALLSGDPLTVPADELMALSVRGTIKRGEWVYRATP